MHYIRRADEPAIVATGLMIGVFSSDGKAADEALVNARNWIDAQPRTYAAAVAVSAFLRF